MFNRSTTTTLSHTYGRAIHPEGFDAGVLAKQKGLAKMPPTEMPGDITEQLAYEDAWRYGWDSADVVFELAKDRIVQAVSLMSDDQIAMEHKNMKRNWYVALRAGTPESAWQHAIVREQRRRETAETVNENVEPALAFA